LLRTVIARERSDEAIQTKRLWSALFLCPFANARAAWIVSAFWPLAAVGFYAFALRTDPDEGCICFVLIASLSLAMTFSCDQRRL
jgi:hypothetical protein